MKPTPITDAAVQFVMQQLKEQPTICQDHPFYVMDVMKAESRKIERQLSDAMEREKALRQELAIEVTNGERLAGVLKLLHDNLAEYQRINNIGGYDNQDMKLARAALALHESGDEPTYTDCPIHGRHEGDCPRC